MFSNGPVNQIENKVVDLLKKEVASTRVQN